MGRRGSRSLANRSSGMIHGFVYRIRYRQCPTKKNLWSEQVLVDGSPWSLPCDGFDAYIEDCGERTPLNVFDPLIETMPEMTLGGSPSGGSQVESRTVMIVFCLPADPKTDADAR